MPTDAEVVRAGVDAAESVIFSRYDRTEVVDLDVTVKFESGTLHVDVYLNVPESPDSDAVADDAALAARSAVDDLLEG